MPRPRKTDEERRTIRKEFWFTASEYAAFVSAAADARLNPPDFARARLCSVASKKAYPQKSSGNVQSAIALMEIAKELRNIAALKQESGQYSNRLPIVLSKLDTALERAMLS